MLVTYSEMVQLDTPALIVPLGTEIVREPAVADTVVLVHVVVALGGLAATRPTGSVSVKFQPALAPSSLVLTIVKVRSDRCPVTIDVGEKDLYIVGDASYTRTLSMPPSLPLPPPWRFATRTPRLVPV